MKGFFFFISSWSSQITEVMSTIEEPSKKWNLSLVEILNNV